MNFLIATALFTILLVGIGLPGITSTISSVVPCNPTATNLTGELVNGACPTGSSPSPASQVGLQKGDTITKVGTTPVNAWADLGPALKASSGTTTVTYERNGTPSTVSVTLVPVVVPVLDPTTGKPTGKTVTKDFLGVAPTMGYQRQSLTAVPPYIWDITKQSVAALVSLPVKVYDLTTSLVSGAPRQADGPVSVVGVTRIGGEVAGSSSDLVDKIWVLLALIASLNLFLFIFNLIPLPPLDGGHVAGALWEGFKKTLARIRHKADPGPADTVRMLPVAYAMTVLILLMGVIVIIADIIKPITF